MTHVNNEVATLNAQQLAHFFNVSTSTVSNFIKSYGFPAVGKEKGRNNYFAVYSQVTKWAKNQESNERTKRFRHKAHSYRYYSVDWEKLKLKESYFKNFSHDGYISSRTYKEAVDNQFILYPLVDKFDFPLAFIIGSMQYFKTKDVLEWYRKQGLLINDLDPAGVKTPAGTMILNEKTESNDVQDPKLLFDFLIEILSRRREEDKHIIVLLEAMKNNYVLQPLHRSCEPKQLELAEV